MGIERAGFDLATAIELDANHSAVHSFNFPRSPVLQVDANRVSKAAICESIRSGLARHGRHNAWRSRVDLVVGGPPCQGFSAGGTHNPDDHRNELVFSFARIVRELKPRYFIMENVPGLLRTKHRAIWDRLCNSLVDAGYELAIPAVLNAANFGVPQTRKRLFLYGWRRGEAAVATPVGIASTTVSVAEALQGLPDASTFPYLYDCDLLNVKRLNRAAQLRLDAEINTYAKSMSTDVSARGFTRSWNRRILSGMALTEHSRDVVRRFEATKPGERELVSRYARLDPTGLSPTLRSGTGPDHGSHTPPRPIHPSGTRVITVREAGRLHSFPDWFTFHATKWHAWRGIGNAVPPLMATAVAKQVADIVGALDVSNGILEPGDYRTIGYCGVP